MIKADLKNYDEKNDIIFVEIVRSGLWKRGNFLAIHLLPENKDLRKLHWR